MTSALPVSSPEAQGLPSHAITRFLDGCEQAGLQLHAFQLLRRGHILAEGAWAPFRLEAPHALYSVSKSFVSTAVGFAVSEGLLGLDDPVLSFFPEHAPEVVGEHLAAMRVHDLLTMTTGHDEDPTDTMFGDQPQPWVRTFLAQPVPRPPGTHFVYNSAATYMLAATVERVSGQGLLDYLEPRLFGPLGIAGATWDTNAEGAPFGGWGLSLPVGALARLGQLYLQRGVWEGVQLLSASWAEQATSAQVSNGDPNAPSDSASDCSNDWAQGYGFQFWRCQHGAYRADGAFGQYIVVMPAQQAVLAILSSVDEMQAVLDQVWTHLLPAFANEPLQDDAEAVTHLREKCAGLAIPALAGESRSPSAALLKGQSYVFESNAWELERLSFDELGAGVEVTLIFSHGTYVHQAAFVGWSEHSTPGMFGRPLHWAGSAAWTGADTLHLDLLELQNTGTLALDLRVLEDGLRLGVEAAFLRTFRQSGLLRAVGSLES